MINLHKIQNYEVLHDHTMCTGLGLHNVGQNANDMSHAFLHRQVRMNQIMETILLSRTRTKQVSQRVTVDGCGRPEVPSQTFIITDSGK